MAPYARRARARLLRRSRRAPRRRSPPRSALRASAAGRPAAPSGCEQADDLVLVAGMRGDHRDALIARRASRRVAGAGRPPRRWSCLADRRPTRAAGCTSRPGLQLSERETGEPPTSCSTRSRAVGCSGCPSPSEGDVYLDFEGDPCADDGAGREYLAGLWDRAGASPRSGRTTSTRRALTADLLDWLIAAGCGADPGMHVYHYAAYEPTALKRLTGRHGTREAELDQLLRGERFVDLYAVVRQGLRISKPSYSIKKVEDFYWGTPAPRGEGVADAMSSASSSTKRWLVDGDDRDPRRHPRLQRGRRPLDPRPARLAGAAAGRARAAHGPCRARPRTDGAASETQPTRSAPRPRSPTGSTTAGHELLAGARRLAPARGPPGVVGLLPLQGPRRPRRSSTTPRRSASSRRAVPTTGTSSSPRCGATRSRRRTARSPPASDVARRRHRHARSARSSSWTPPPGWLVLKAARSRAARPARSRAPGRPSDQVLRESIADDRRDVLAGGSTPRARRCSSAGAARAAARCAGETPDRRGGPGRARARRRGARRPGPARHAARHAGAR